ncbi:MAG: nuclear transport factor 2 family protein [Acidobacteriia bacterium]|nr:nuclear transport factor 2 family protein [Terriglobia bacterium]
MDARVFTDRWISDWNRKDVEAVLSNLSEDVVFTSPRAKAIVGSSRVEGKSSLREYWTKAIDRIQTIHFTLDYVISDGDRVGIVYIAEIDGRRMRCVEFMVFGGDGLVRQGEAMHGVEL